VVKSTKQVVFCALDDRLAIQSVIAPVAIFRKQHAVTGHGQAL
jgi:hypothetical protein